jgi:hypothetical protein
MGKLFGSGTGTLMSGIEQVAAGPAVVGGSIRRFKSTESSSRSVKVLPDLGGTN